MATTSPTDPDEVVATVQAAFTAVRAERDEARALLRQVTAADYGNEGTANGYHVAYIAPDVMQRIQQLASRTP